MNALPKHWLSIPILLIAFLLFGFILGRQSQKTPTPPIEQPATQPAAPIVAKPSPAPQSFSPTSKSVYSIPVTPTPKPLMPFPNNKKWNSVASCRIHDTFEGTLKNYFQNANGLKIVVNWNAIEKERPGIKKTIIRLNLKNVAFWKIFFMAMRSASAGDPELGFMAVEDTIFIDLEKNLKDIVITCAFDCSSLLKNYVPFFSDSDFVKHKDSSHLSLQEWKENLSASIMSSIDKNGWKHNDDSSSLTWRGTWLIVTTTIQNQRAAILLLEQLMDSFNETDLKQ